MSQIHEKNLQALTQGYSTYYRKGKSCGRTRRKNRKKNIRRAPSNPKRPFIRPDIAYYPVIWAKRRNVIHQAIDYHREFFEIGMLLMLYTSYVSIDWVMIGHVARLHQGRQTGQRFV
ncbi:hypothetical protein CDAR_618481 [Caerostris darwini]|uniref:Uncharacterized protein n=1 Tax=Caerostris darwini TaxID=1538125 RepID=A0AAV4SWR1_9ARAC|nr:hypothetical protein CDAR_618481 [Caerostris darwini]